MATAHVREGWPPTVLTVGLISSDELYAGALAAALASAQDIEAWVILTQENPVPDVSTSGVFVLHTTPLDEATTRVLAGRAPVLVLGDGSPEEMIGAVESGAMGYLDAGSPLSAITDAVRSLAKGVATVEPSLLGALLRHVVDRQRSERLALGTLEVLTQREREVFEMLAMGLDSGQVADRLFISVQTVRTHTRRLMAKLDLHSRGELIALAARAGLVLDSEEESQ